MQMFDPSLVAELKSAVQSLAARYRRLMQVYEKGAGRLAAGAGISADAKVLWSEATWATKRDELTRLQAATARLQAEMQEQAELTALPRQTNPAVKQKMRERVATWPDDQPAPNEEEDFAAISALFAPGSLSRDDFRIIRTDDSVVPSEWRKQGRRRPWGQVKPKSAA
jgi:hypothetical protein